MMKSKESLIGNITSKESLIGNTTSKESLVGILNNPVKPVYPEIQEKTIIPTKENQIVVPDEDVYALSKVIVEPA